MSNGPVEIHGTCEPGFEPVREAFAANFAERGEIGASAAVVAGGRPVVNLWAGWFRHGQSGFTVVAVDASGTVLGTAECGPNHGGPGAHVASASFMVDS